MRRSIFCLFAFSVALTAMPAAAQTENGYLLRLLTANVYREQYIFLAMQEFRKRAGEDQILDPSDLAGNDEVSAAMQRATIVQLVLRNDLDGDGVVDTEELRRALAPMAARRPQQIEPMIRGYLLADGDGDGRITLAEAMAYAKLRAVEDPAQPRRRLGIESLLARQPDGRLTADELEAAARDVFATYDKNGDGHLSPDEAAALAGIVGRSDIVGRAFDCGLPKPSEKAQIIVIGGYEAGTLSSVTIAGQDRVTETQELSIAPGDTPLYVVASSFTPMIWRVTGAAARVERFVTGGAAGAGTRSAGAVTGLDKDKVTFAHPACVSLPYKEDAATVEAISRSMEAIHGRAPAEILLSYTLQNHGIARNRNEALGIRLEGGPQAQAPAQAARRSAFVTFARGTPAPFDGKGGRIDETTYRQMLRFSPGGVASLKAEDVISSTPAEPYEVLPQEAGLVQLLGSGQIEYAAPMERRRPRQPGAPGAEARTAPEQRTFVPRSGRGTYRIVAPIPRYPAGLSGAHSVAFIVARGVAAPAGNPGHSTVISEETGEPLHRPGQQVAPDVIDPFRNAGGGPGR